LSGDQNKKQTSEMARRGERETEMVRSGAVDHRLYT